MKKILRIISRFYNIKWVKWGLIPISLFIFWISASLSFYPHASFTTLLHIHEKDFSTNLPQNILLKGRKISGEFKAVDNYLGILAMKFNIIGDTNFKEDDILVFRIKEKESKAWHYENSYKSRTIYTSPFFPFGFPIIENSKNKIYQFELTSLRGNSDNAIGVKESEFYITSYYKYSRFEILSSPPNLFSYLSKKIITSFSNLQFFLYSTLYLIPLFYYMLWQLFGKSTKKIVKRVISIDKVYSRLTKVRSYPVVVVAKVIVVQYKLLLLVFLFTIMDIIFLKETYIGMFLGLLGLWIVVIRLFRLSNKNILFLASSLFLLYIILRALNYYISADKASVWIYIFIVIAVIKALRELILEQKKVK